jgi:hypothetical protein
MTTSMNRQQNYLREFQLGCKLLKTLYGSCIHFVPKYKTSKYNWQHFKQLHHPLIQEGSPSIHFTRHDNGLDYHRFDLKWADAVRLRKEHNLTHADGYRKLGRLLSSGNFTPLIQILNLNSKQLLITATLHASLKDSHDRLLPVNHQPKSAAT